eukprot:m.87441 g.87441  ORF g.87441 m.87441 type:complete len:107 (+) comp13107_c0_seq6:1120-1440(+)
MKEVPRQTTKLLVMVGNKYSISVDSLVWDRDETFDLTPHMYVQERAAQVALLQGYVSFRMDAASTVRYHHGKEGGVEELSRGKQMRVAYTEHKLIALTWLNQLTLN